MTDVAIIPTGTANLASVKAAFRRLGANPIIVDHADGIDQASHVMLPGVGAFGAAMKQLAALGLAEALKQRIAANRPTIGICVGHQLFFATSDESPGVTGLAIIDAHIERFPGNVRVPQFGWNKIMPEAAMNLFDEGYAYFANSHRATAAPGWRVAKADHGGPFVAAIEKDNIMGCQFHPELSHDFGESLLSRFLALN